MHDEIVVIYHANCSDGFAAALAAWKELGDDATYYPASYGEEPPDVHKKQVFMVDFSYKRPVLLEMAAKAESIVILDHHDTAEQELVDLPSNVTAIFDQAKSGAVLAWEYFVGPDVPGLINIVQDRDLWQFKLPGTRAITAAIFSYNWTFELWDSWLETTGAVTQLWNEGAALLRSQDKNIQALCDPAHVDFTAFDIDGERVEAPTVNCPWMFASDVGHELCNRYPDAPLSVTYMVGRDKVKFSLRSNDKIHCGKIAEKFGGGGHPNAAGFHVSHAVYAQAMLISAAAKAQEVEDATE